MIDSYFDFSVTAVNAVTERRSEDWDVRNLVFSGSYVLAICLDGEADYTLSDGAELHAAKNGVFLFPPVIRRSGRSVPSDPWHFISVNFDVYYPADQQRKLQDYLPYYAGGISEAIRSKFVKIASLWREKDSLFKLRCRTLIEEILFDMLTQTKNSKPFAHASEIEAVLLYLRRNFTKPVVVSDLADIHGLSDTHFRKLFRKAVGMSVKEYLIRLRLDYAADLLRSGVCNVTEAAEASGFDDIFYFSALYKKKTGCAPSSLLGSSDV